jgi:MSHA biogenesis protein MshQ
MSKQFLWAALALALSFHASFATTVGYWRFEEGSAGSAATGTGTILDSSGNGFNGTPMNGPTYSSSVAANPIPQTGAANKLSLNFNGSSQFIYVPDETAFQLTQSLTLEAYVYIRSAPSGVDRYIIFRGDDRVGFDPYSLGVANGNIDFNITNSQNVTTTVSTAVPAFNQWLHIAGTLDNATGDMDLYVNNTLDASTVTTNRPFGALIANQIPGLGFGNTEDANYFEYFDGLIDEIRMSNVALAPSQFLDSLPEPASMSLLGLAGICVLRKRVD